MSESSGPGPSSPHDAARERMVARHLRARGIRDARVLEAMARVPRELFVPDHLADDAYADSPLPIGHGQTISQPFIVALTAEAARISPGDRVLDVGTGSGYAATVYAAMGARVWSVEYVPELAEAARAALDAASAAHVRVVVGDGSRGLPEHAPFDAILSAAAASDIPPPWRAQLADGGRIVMPRERHAGWQQLVRVTRRGDREEPDDLGPVRFVPLRGEHGRA